MLHTRRIKVNNNNAKVCIKSSNVRYVTLTELGISFYPLLQLKLLTQKIERWNFSLRIWVGKSERKSPGPFILSCTWTISLNGIARQKFSMWVSYIKDFYHTRTRTVYTYLCTRIWENRFTCVITYVIQYSDFTQ